MSHESFKSFRNYGIPDPVVSAEPQHPNDLLKGCLQAGREALEDTILLQEQVPWQAIPRRGNTIFTLRRGVLNVASSVNSAANAGGLTLIAAQELYQDLDLESTTTSATLPEWATIWEITPTANQVAVITGWGISVINHEPEALNVSLVGGGLSGLPSPPNPASSSYLAEGHQPVHVIVPPNRNLGVQVSLRANTAALLVYFSVSYYTFPVTKYADNSRGLLLRDGFKGCKP